MPFTHYQHHITRHSRLTSLVMVIMDRLCVTPTTTLPSLTVTYYNKHALYTLPQKHQSPLTKAPFTRYNLLSNQLSKRFDNWLYRVYKHSTGYQTHLTTGLTTSCIMYTAGCQTGCTTWFDNRLNKQWLFVQHGCQTGCTTHLTTVLNEQSVRSTRLLNNRFDNQLYHVNKHPTGCQTTGWMFVYTIQPVVKPVFKTG